MISSGSETYYGLSATVTNSTGIHRLGVFAGDDCDNLGCVGNVTGDPWSTGASVDWTRGEESETFYILLQSVDNFEGGTEFELSMGTWAVARRGSG